MDGEIKVLSGATAYQLVSRYLKHPTVFKRMINSWPCKNWTLNDWAKRLENKNVRFRVGRKNEKNVDPIWEGDCHYIGATLVEFNSWLNNWPNVSSENTFHELNPKNFWCYADYQYMARLFEKDENTLQSINWEVFGFDGRNANDTAIWIGSEGAHTPCHYDTYGYNLVAQLLGKKRWILFPPTQIQELQPTRIPYEESSVFSKINIQNPQLNLYPSFKDTTPYIVCLEPGDVLFVPRHWWHYVETLETSISVNTWIETTEDHDSRLDEAITRFLMMSLAPAVNVPNWLNPTEQCTSIEDNLTFVQMTLSKIIDQQNNLEARKSLDADNTVESSTPSPKRQRFSQDDEIVLSVTLHDYKESIEPIEPVSFDYYLGLIKYDCQCTNFSATESDFSLDESKFPSVLLNSIVNPSVISEIVNKLKRNCK